MEADPSVRVVVMEGAGNKAFCAGGDIIGTVCIAVCKAMSLKKAS